MSARSVLVVASIALLFSEPVCSQQDGTRSSSGGFGTDVVDATVSMLNRLTERNRDLSQDNGFIRRIAYVETDDGMSPDTYSDTEYHGGIWKVDRSVFEVTVGLSNNQNYDSIFRDIQRLLGINWSQVRWEDCRKPLYSALAARLYFHSLRSDIPMRLQDQAIFWRDEYHDQPTKTVENFIMRVETLESEGCPVKAIDLVFVVDSSGSVQSKNFEIIKNFVASIVESFDIGADNTRVGFIRYSSDVEVEFNLNTYYDKTSLLEAIEDITYVYGVTQTVSALNATNNAFRFRNGARHPMNCVPRVAVVITDGRSQGPEAVAVPANQKRHRGITIFAIGVTDNVNKDELNAIANKPNDTYVFHVSSFNAMDNIVTSLKERACKASCMLREQKVNNSMGLGDRQFLKQRVTREGITLGLTAQEGNVVMYLSTTIPNPNEAFYDYRLEAEEGQGRVEVFIGPEVFTKEEGSSQDIDGGSVQALRQNDTGDGFPLSTVYMTMVGLRNTSDFVLRATEGDVTKPVTEEPQTTAAAGTKATAYIGLMVVVAALLMKSAVC